MFPALFDEGKSVGVRAFADPLRAAEAHRGGCVRLLMLAAGRSRGVDRQAVSAGDGGAGGTAADRPGGDDGRVGGGGGGGGAGQRVAAQRGGVAGGRSAGRAGAGTGRRSGSAARSTWSFECLPGIREWIGREKERATSGGGGGGPRGGTGVVAAAAVCVAGGVCAAGRITGGIFRRSAHAWDGSRACRSRGISRRWSGCAVVGALAGEVDRARRMTRGGGSSAGCSRSGGSGCSRRICGRRGCRRRSWSGRGGGGVPSRRP